MPHHWSWVCEGKSCLRRVAAGTGHRRKVHLDSAPQGSRAEPALMCVHKPLTTPASWERCLWLEETAGEKPQDSVQVCVYWCVFECVFVWMWTLTCVRSFWLSVVICGFLTVWQVRVSASERMFSLRSWLQCHLASYKIHWLPQIPLFSRSVCIT